LGGESEGSIAGSRERGLIDGASFKQFSLTGKRDEFGIVVDNGTSLRRLMGLCHDF
jgi:hypothetical protein